MQNETLTRLKINLEYHIGLLELPRKTKQFIFTHFNFLLFTTIPGVFINTFFFRQDGKISTVAIYNAVCVFGLALVMQFSSQISLKKSPVFVLRIGVALFNIFYICLLVFQKDAVRYMLLLAVINAIASGFYWQGYNELVKLFTSEDIFDRTVSLIGFSSAVVTLFIPMFSGLVITYCGNGLGYFVIFAVAFVFSLYTTYLTTRIGKAKINGKSNLAGTYHYIFEHKNVLCVCLAELLRGIKNTAFPLFLNIIFFKFVTNESFLGINNMLCGLASILSYAIAGKIIRPNNRLKNILVASAVSTVMFLPLFFIMNSAAVFVLAIVNAFICAFIDNPAIGVFYGTFENSFGGITFSQLMAAREVFFAVGRVAGCVLLIVFSGSFLMLAVFSLIANLSTVVTWAFLHLSFKLKPGAEAKTD